MKKTIKFALVAIAVFGVTTISNIDADSHTVENTFCTTITTIYGSETECDTETIDAGFIPTEIIAIASASFMVGVSALVVKNYTEEQI